MSKQEAMNILDQEVNSGNWEFESVLSALAEIQQLFINTHVDALVNIVKEWETATPHTLTMSKTMCKTVKYQLIETGLIDVFALYLLVI